jgi:HAD superfamily hydrolase (TIGR01509 family)
MLRAVLFDVGGPIDTEVRFEEFIDSHIRAALASEGTTVTDSDYAAAAAYAVESFAPSACASIVWRLAAGNRELTTRVLEAVNARSEERATLRGGIELRPGIADLIHALHARGVPLGLAANQPTRILADLERHGLAECFRAREVTGVHGLRKPDVRLFLRACELLDAPPEDCVMVGDRIDNDIAPAAWLGMRTVLFRTGRHRAQQPRSASEVPDCEGCPRPRRRPRGTAVRSVGGGEARLTHREVHGRIPPIPVRGDLVEPRRGSRHVRIAQPSDEVVH